MDLEDCRKSWRWFTVRLTYLISMDGPLYRALHPTAEPEPPADTGWTD